MKVCLNCDFVFERADWICPTCCKHPPEILGHLAFAPQSATSSSGFEAKNFDQLSKVEEKYFWFQNRNLLILWALKKHFPQASSFLEIGCGTGFVLSAIKNHFPHLKVFGSEMVSHGLQHAFKRAPDVVLFQMDARRIPFSQEFDIIGAFDVLEHIQEDKMVLQQMNKALQPNGGILITVPHHPFLWSTVDKSSGHFRRYTAKELKRKVQAAGFQILYVTSFVTLLMPLIFISRLLKSRNSKNYDPLSEFKIGDFTNRLLQKILDLERKIIELGLRMPMGSSLLLIGKKIE